MEVNTATVSLLYFREYVESTLPLVSFAFAILRFLFSSDSLPGLYAFTHTTLTHKYCIATADSFQVYQGLVRNLTAFHFANVLRHPSCFYFFSASAIPNDASPDLEDSVMQRDICWLTGMTYVSFVVSILLSFHAPSLHKMRLFM